MHIDVKETIWHRLVIDESYEAEVTKMLYEGKSYADVISFLYSKGEENTQVEYLFETTQGIEPEQNNGDNTIELIDNDGNTVWGNFYPCQDFREKKECHCNLYLPKPEEDEQESSIS